MASVMSIKEAAHISGLSVYAIRTGIKQGIFPAFRINGTGSKYFIDYNQFQIAIQDLSSRYIQNDYESRYAINDSGIRKIKE
jgi:DNA-binding transcriptional MerR regulator